MGVVTVTFTRPVPAGLVAVICTAELTVNLAALLEPKSTNVAPVKPVPMMTTEVPPVGARSAGVTFVTVGPLLTSVLAWATVGVGWTMPTLLVATL